MCAALAATCAPVLIDCIRCGVSATAVSALALSSRFLKDGASLRDVTLYVGPFAFVAPASIMFGAWAGDLDGVLHLVLSCFAAGTFLYVGASEVLTEEFEGDMRRGRYDISQTTARYVKFGAVALAVGCIALMSLIPHAHEHGGHVHSHGAHVHVHHDH